MEQLLWDLGTLPEHSGICLLNCLPPQVQAHQRGPSWVLAPLPWGPRPGSRPLLASAPHLTDGGRGQHLVPQCPARVRKWVPGPCHQLRWSEWQGASGGPCSGRRPEEQLDGGTGGPTQGAGRVWGAGGRAAGGQETRQGGSQVREAGTGPSELPPLVPPGAL